MFFYFFALKIYKLWYQAFPDFDLDNPISRMQIAPLSTFHVLHPNFKCDLFFQNFVDTLKAKALWLIVFLVIILLLHLINAPSFLIELPTGIQAFRCIVGFAVQRDRKKDYKRFMQGHASQYFALPILKANSLVNIYQVIMTIFTSLGYVLIGLLLK